MSSKNWACCGSPFTDHGDTNDSANGAYKTTETHEDDRPHSMRPLMRAKLAKLVPKLMQWKSRGISVQRFSPLPDHGELLYPHLSGITIDHSSVTRFAHYLRRRYHLTDFAVSITFASAQQSRELNNQHRQIDHATDVLSFPQLSLTPGEPPPSTSSTFTHGAHLGDVVICVAKVFDYAARENPALQKMSREETMGHLHHKLLFTITHGFLHLIGHDHMEPNEAQLMAQEEAACLNQWPSHHRSVIKLRSRRLDFRVRKRSPWSRIHLKSSN